MAPQVVEFRLSQLKHKVLRKSFEVPTDGPIELFCFHAIEGGQVRIEHDFLAADEQNRLLDAFAGDWDFVLVMTASNFAESYPTASRGAPGHNFLTPHEQNFLLDALDGAAPTLIRVYKSATFL